VELPVSPYKPIWCWKPQHLHLNNDDAFTPYRVFLGATLIMNKNGEKNEAQDFTQILFLVILQ
jgi:hypothetical protein